MTPAVRLALHLGLTEFLRQREELDTKIADVRAALGETEPAVEPSPVRVLPALSSAPPGVTTTVLSSTALCRFVNCDAPPPAEELRRYIGMGRAAFSAAHPRPEWTDAEGVTRRLYVGGDAQNAHMHLHIGIPQALGLRRGFWLTAAEADRMAQHKRDRAGTRKAANTPSPAPAEEDWRKGRHLVRDAAMVRKAQDLGVGRLVGDVVWLTPLEDGQVRAHLRAS